MLDEAGLQTCKITVSKALDERIIHDLLMQGASVDTFGVGESLLQLKVLCFRMCIQACGGGG